MAQFEKGKSGNESTQFKSGEQAEAAGRKGGIASGESRRRTKSLKEALKILAEQEHTSKSGEVRQGFEVLAMGLFNKAMKGNPLAWKLYAEMMGEYKQSVDLTSGGKTLNFVNTDPETEANIRKLYDTDNGISADDSGV